MKKKLLILLSLLFFTPFVIKAEELQMEWQKSWGGANYEELKQIVVTDDGGFVVLGYFDSTDIDGLNNNGSTDGLMAKYDKDGNLLWQKNWGGSGADRFEAIAVTKDGGFIVGGYFRSTDIEGLDNTGVDDDMIVKFDKDGNLLWQKNLEDEISNSIYSVAAADDGGFVVVGVKNNNNIHDALIAKFDKDGNLLWQKNWGGSSYDGFRSITETKDGGFIVGGYFRSTDIEGMTIKGGIGTAIVKYDKDGNLLWQKAWGGSSEDTIWSIAVTKDDGFIVGGQFNSTDIEGLPNKGGCDAVIVKFDKDGNLLWQKSLGGSESETFYSIAETKYGEFIAGGYFTSTDIEGLNNNGGAPNGFIVKYNKDGNLLWQKSFGGSSVDVFYSALPTEDNEFVVCGFFNSTDIEGMVNRGAYDLMVLKYSIEYDLVIAGSANGMSVVEQRGNFGFVTPTPNEGYEVDKIIVKDKDGNVLDVEVNKQEDGTYSFDLYTDVSVEVIYKEAIENPKTGILDVITILFVGLFISFSGFVFVKRYNERLEF